MTSRSTNLILPGYSPSASQRHRALDEFAGLLSQLKQKKAPTEQTWQDFFTRNPFVFTDTIPVRFDSLYSQFRLSSGPVDFLFHKSTTEPFFSTTGLIEIKRPEHAIIDIYGSHMGLAKNTANALIQLKDYLKDLEDGVLLANQGSFAIGNNRVVFIVIGRTQEILKKCHNELRQKQFQNLLPLGFQILTYDYVFETLRSKTPPIISCVVAKEYVEPRFSLLIIYGPPGSGKSTVARAMVEKPRRTCCKILAKYGTRGPRLNEQESPFYRFPDPDEFHKLLRQEKIICPYSRFGYYYGFSRDHLSELAKQQCTALCTVSDSHITEDLRAFLRREHIEFTTVLLDVTTHDLVNRLALRAGVPEDLQMRIAEAKNHNAKVHRLIQEGFFDHVIPNGNDIPFISTLDRMWEIVARMNQNKSL